KLNSDAQSVLRGDLVEAAPANNARQQKQPRLLRPAAQTGGHGPHGPLRDRDGVANDSDQPGIHRSEKATLRRSAPHSAGASVILPPRTGGFCLWTPSDEVIPVRARRSDSSSASRA